MNNMSKSDTDDIDLDIMDFSGSPLPVEKIRVKCVLVGNDGVGKSTLIRSIVLGKYDSFMKDEYEYSILEFEFENVKFAFSFYEVSSQEEYARLRPLTYNNTDVFLVCFDINSRESLEQCELLWHQELVEHEPDVPLLLIGNKVDIREEEKLVDPKGEKYSDKLVPPIITKEGFQIAQKLKALNYIETSSKNMKNVREIVIQICRIILIRELKRQKRKKTGIISIFQGVFGSSPKVQVKQGFDQLRRNNLEVLEQKLEQQSEKEVIHLKQILHSDLVESRDKYQKHLSLLPLHIIIHILSLFVIVDLVDLYEFHPRFYGFLGELGMSKDPVSIQKKFFVSTSPKSDNLQTSSKEESEQKIYAGIQHDYENQNNNTTTTTITENDDFHDDQEKKICKVEQLFYNFVIPSYEYLQYLPKRKRFLIIRKHLHEKRHEIVWYNTFYERPRIHFKNFYGGNCNNNNAPRDHTTSRASSTVEIETLQNLIFPDELEFWKNQVSEGSSISAIRNLQFSRDCPLETVQQSYLHISRDWKGIKELGISKKKMESEIEFSSDLVLENLEDLTLRYSAISSHVKFENTPSLRVLELVGHPDQVGGHCPGLTREQYENLLDLKFLEVWRLSRISLFQIQEILDLLLSENWKAREIILYRCDFDLMYLENCVFKKSEIRKILIRSGRKATFNNHYNIRQNNSNNNNNNNNDENNSINRKNKDSRRRQKNNKNDNLFPKEFIENLKKKSSGEETPIMEEEESSSLSSASGRLLRSNDNYRHHKDDRLIYFYIQDSRGRNLTNCTDLIKTFGKYGRT